jgi:hypothetical protein
MNSTLLPQLRKKELFQIENIFNPDDNNNTLCVCLCRPKNKAEGLFSHFVKRKILSPFWIDWIHPFLFLLLLYIISMQHARQPVNDFTLFLLLLLFFRVFQSSR